MSSKKGKKNEKQNKTPEVVQVEERPTEKEIVLGKGLFESDWSQTVREENDLVFICGLIEEVYEKSHSILLYLVTEKETFSFSVQWAKKLLLDKIMCFFIEHDKGESCMSTNYKSVFGGEMDDSEPIPPAIDSWAKGVVPVANQLRNVIKICGQELPNDKSFKISPSFTQKKPMLEEKFKSSTASLKLKRRKCNDTSDQSNKMRVISPPMVLEHCTSLQKSKSDEFSGSCTPFSSTALLNIPPLISDPKLSLRHHSHFTTQTAQLDIKKFPSPSIKPIVSLNISEDSQAQSPSTSFNTRSGKSSTKKKIQYQKHSIKKFPKPSATVHKHHKINEEARIFGGMNRINNSRVLEKPTLPPFLNIVDPLPGVTVYEKGQSVSGYVSSCNKLWSPTSTLHPITPIVKKEIYSKVVSGADQ